jgi:formylglycine-generating enzyme required for sulfatase activity
VGYFGQLDLAGELWEWNLDWLGTTYSDPCVDCAYLPTSASYRLRRGGGFDFDALELAPGGYATDYPTDRGNNNGFRCARTP